MRLLFALFALVPIAAAQTGRIEGRVVTTGGAPLNKATVRLRNTAPAAGQPGPVFVEVTNSDGRFTVQNVAAGRYAVETTKTGFALARNAAGAVQPITLEVASGESKSVEVRMTPLAVVSGVITDSDGEPLQAVRVTLLRYTYSSGRLSLTTNAAAATTDDRGTYRIVNVQPGRYYVQATPGNPVMANEIRGESARTGSLPTYYPNAESFRGALAVNVGVTEISGIDIRLNQGRRHSIKGIFTGATGAASLTVFRRGDNEPSAPGFTTSADGAKSTFQVNGLTPGEYTVILRVTPRPSGPVNRENVQQAAQQQPQFSGRVDVAIGASDLENVEIRLQPGAEISGRVIVEGGDPAAVLAPLPVPVAAIRPDGTAAAQALNIMRGPSVSLLAAEGPAATTQGAVNPDGSFRIANVPPLKRVLQLINLPPNVYLKAIRSGGQDISKTPLDLSSGTGAVLEIVVSAKAASVTVTPRNDRGETPAGGVILAVWPRSPNPASPSGDVRVSNATPALQAQGLPPGEYYAAAWSSSHIDYLRSPEFLARFNSLAKAVTLAEGESASVDVSVIPADAVEKELAQFP